MLLSEVTSFVCASIREEEERVPHHDTLISEREKVL